MQVSRFLNGIKHVPEGALVLLMGIMLADMLLGVVSRYVMRHPFFWIEDVGSLSLLWITFIGGALAVKRGAHFALTAVAEMMPPQVARAMRIASCLLMAVFSVALMVTGVSLMRIAEGAKSPGLDIPLAPLYVVVPLGGALMLIYSLSLAVGYLKPAAAESADPHQEPEQR